MAVAAIEYEAPILLEVGQAVPRSFVGRKVRAPVRAAGIWIGHLPVVIATDKRQSVSVVAVTIY